MASAIRNPLYQVHVETREGNDLPVGPKMIREACEAFRQAIHDQIREGHERTWSNPHIVLA